METAVGMAEGAIAGAAVAGAGATLAAAAAGTATVSTFGAVRAAGAPFVTTRIVVAAPVALPVLAVGAVVGGIGAGVTKLFGLW